MPKTGILFGQMSLIQMENINQEKWFQQTQLPNGYSWYNNELQHYTDE